LVLIRLLGPVDVVDSAGHVHRPASAIRRTLLALFALHPGRVLSADWLLEHVWNGEVPESGILALRFHISHLRRELGTLDLIETCAGGYRLRVAPEEVDTCVVESLGRVARDESDDGRAGQLCLKALAMWRAEPFVDASPASDLTDEAARLDEVRLTLTELGYQRRFKAGEGVELVAELIRFTADHPLREALWMVLIAAQYRVGRQADALRSYDTVRSILVETLGVEPSQDLQELHQRVLNHDPTLGAAPGHPSVLMLWEVAGATGVLVRQGQAGINLLASVCEVVAGIAPHHGGHVSTSQGEVDGAVVLFGSVRDAVAAAIEVNTCITQRSWPDDELVAVRSAIHVGDVTVTAEGVFGSEVYRCARLRALADGGEVLLSDAAVTSAGQSLPDGSSAVDEGFVLLPGSETETEHLWRLAHPVLRSRQRAVQRATSPTAALPVWRTSFVGRSEDVASIGARLDAGRLVTLVGPAGVGKTRLAAAVAGAASGHAHFVDLTVATKDDEVDGLVADAVGSSRDSAPRKGIEAILRAAPALLVLDNCEHVLDSVASLVESVLADCEGSSVLATSRSALRVPEEDVFSVAPLLTAPGGPAMQLFIDRARAALGELSTDVRTLDQIGAVTAILDGVPLAIELAAARVTAFSVGEILEMLQHDMAGLGDARRRGPDRHRSVRAAIEWSVRMLSHDERRVLGRLAMLPGSFRLGAATAVASGGEVDERVVVEALQAFVDQSLIAAQHRTGPTRYRMLEMIRSVAQDEIDAQEQDEVLDRLLAHCLVQLSGLDGPVTPEAGFEEESRLDAGLFSVSIEHALATDQIESGLQLVYYLFTPWHGRTQRSTLDRWSSDLVAKTTAPSSLRAMVLRRQAIIASEDVNDDARATRLLDAAAADATALNDRSLLGRIQSNLAVQLLHGPEYVGFEDLDRRLCEAIALLEECADPYVSESLLELAYLYTRHGKFDQTEDLLSRAEAVHPPWFVLIKIEMQRALCALSAGRVGLATTHAAKALDMAEQSGDPEWIAQAGGVAAGAALARGETALAEQLWVRLVALAREHDLSTQIESLAELAVVSVLQGDLTVARSCRDELRSQLPGTRVAETDRALARLACAFVDLADGDADGAAEAGAEVLADAERQHISIARVLSLELIAASIAGTDRQRARDLLAEASRQRVAIGASEGPVEPFRDAALRTLEALASDAGQL